jgi:hypothetical protein
MTELLPPIIVKPRIGSEPFHLAGQPVGFDVASFWRWSASDLVSNVYRGVLAEYIVARSLGIVDGVRTEWDVCDLRTSTGLLVEVKSAAYLQSWHQRTHSPISFDIGLKRAWDAATNLSASEPCRSADVYVFALLAHRDKATLDPLDLAQWEFYVVGTNDLEAAFGNQTRLSLSSLRRIAPNPQSFEGLSVAVAKAGARKGHTRRGLVD